MGIHIVVCVKNTPGTLNVPIDSASGKIKKEGLSYGVNPFDEYAIEEAVRIKERLPGSSATVLTAGPQSSEAAVREALARSLDNGILVSASELQDPNPFATSLILSSAIKKLNAEKPVQLVLFGKNTNDGGSGLTGALVGARLNFSTVISVKKIDAIDDKSATLWRMMEDGTDIVKVALPAAISTVKEINEPRLPSLKGKMASKKAVIPKWTLSDIGLNAQDFGNALALTKIERSSPPPSRPVGIKIDSGTPAEKAKKLVDLLIERKLV